MSLKETIDGLEELYGEGVIKPMSIDNSKVDIISSGIPSLDFILGCGGYPRGKVVELYGPESSGKSTLALLAVKEAQDKGLKVAYVDAEHALDIGLASIMGVDVKKLLLSRPDNGEQGIDIVKKLVDSGEVGMIVVDSVAALVPRAEQEGEVGDSVMGIQAKLMSQAMRLLVAPAANTNTLLMFINQLRMKIGVVYGNPEVTTGGQALKFYSSVRLEVRRGTPIKTGDNVIGAKTKVKVVKNKLSAPFRTTEFDLIYGHRPDITTDYINLAITRGVITKHGSWYRLGDVQLGQGVNGVRDYLGSNPDVLERIVQASLVK